MRLAATLIVFVGCHGAAVGDGGGASASVHREDDRRLQGFLCDIPMTGCVNGMFNRETCECECIPPFCRDANGYCLDSSSNCWDNPWADCARGVNCPWWANPAEKGRCSTGPRVPSGVSQIYNTRTACCNVNVPFSSACDAQPTVIDIPETALNDGIRPCTPTHECMHGSTCVFEYPTGLPYCDCTTATSDNGRLIKFAGIYCNVEATSYCSDQAGNTEFCVNNGSCIIGSSPPRCKCDPGLLGRHCEFPVDFLDYSAHFHFEEYHLIDGDEEAFAPVVSDDVPKVESTEIPDAALNNCLSTNKCMHNSTCMVEPSTGNQYCDCSNAFSDDGRLGVLFAGRHCEFEVTSYCSRLGADAHFCVNGGTCSGISWCRCPDGFRGRHCEFVFKQEHFMDDDEIAYVLPDDDPVMDDQGVEEENAGDDFVGMDDAVDSDCTLICHNGGSCRKGPGGRDYCICPPEHSCAQCQCPTPPPIGRPTPFPSTSFAPVSCEPECLNGGFCRDGLGFGNFCTCPPGFTGAYCETKMPFSHSTPPATPPPIHSSLETSDCSFFATNSLGRLSSFESFCGGGAGYADLGSPIHDIAVDPRTFRAYALRGSEIIEFDLKDGTIRPGSLKPKVGGQSAMAYFDGIAFAKQRLYGNGQLILESGDISDKAVLYEMDSVTLEVLSRGPILPTPIVGLTHSNNQANVLYAISSCDNNSNLYAIDLDTKVSRTICEDLPACFESLAYHPGEDALYGGTADGCIAEIVKNECRVLDCDTAFAWSSHFDNVTGLSVVCPRAQSYSPSPTMDPTSPHTGIDTTSSDTFAHLSKFYVSTSGRSWTNNTNWMSDQNTCTWHGIECDDAGIIVGINLPQNRLVGRGITYLEYLPSIRRLNLSNNELGSTLPSFSQHRLESLDLSANQFVGSLPHSFLSSSTSLLHLDLSDNRVTGHLHDFSWTGGGTFQLLQYLNMSSNDLSSSIPVEIGNMNALEYIDFSHNSFTFAFQESYYRGLQNLTSLRLSHNNLFGDLPSYEQYPKLREVDVSHNEMKGPIPNNIFGNTSLETLISLDISHNYFGGVFPNLPHIRRLNVNAVGNRFVRIDEVVCEKDSWNNGDITRFGCDGFMCPPETSNRIGRQTSDDSPCVECPVAEFYGTTSCAPPSTRPTQQPSGGIQDRREYEALEIFYKSTNGERWDRNDYWLSEDVTVCRWYGIVCNTDNRVTELILPSNGLDGYLEPKVFSLLPFIEVIDLSGNKVKNEYYFPNALSLRELNLQSNLLSGPLPAKPEYPKLEKLLLGNNSLTGTISDGYMGLVNLKELDLGANMISGTLLSFSEAAQLHRLNVSNNRLTGTIPEDLLQASFEKTNDGVTGTIPEDFTTSKLQIHVPKTLNKPGGYEHREALFGIPPHGGSIAQKMYYTEDTMCEFNTIDTRSGYPSRAKDEDGNMLPWQPPFILMVDRGGCTFVQKVRNAQRVGAAGVIVADSSCLCSAESQGKCHSDPGQECEEREPIMADDGSGSDISIPSFLMFKQDADSVKTEVRANHLVRIEMTWSLPNPDDRVEYELWTTPTDIISRDFQKDFKEAAVALGKRAYFTPQMYIYDGIRSGCQGIDGENDCYNLCTNNGRYCATDPGNDLDRGISGADVVRESLRRMCIWKHYGEDDGVGVAWWDYVNEFMYRCKTEEYFSSKQCIADSMAHAQIDGNRIEQCMSDSGGFEGDVANQLLEVQLLAKDKSGVVTLPAMYVNRVSIRGSLEFEVVFKAICAGYASGTIPSVCTTCSACSDQKACISNGFCGSKKYDENPPIHSIPFIVDVSFNYLGGVVPAFEVNSLQINVTGNRLTALDQEICERYSWNGRGVDEFGCDAVACPVLTANSEGRQTSESTPCDSCPTAVYIGTVACPPDENLFLPHPSTSKTTTQPSPSPIVLLKTFSLYQIPSYVMVTSSSSEIQTQAALSELEDISSSFLRDTFTQSLGVENSLYITTLKATEADRSDFESSVRTRERRMQSMGYYEAFFYVDGIVGIRDGLFNITAAVEDYIATSLGKAFQSRDELLNLIQASLDTTLQTVSFIELSAEIEVCPNNLKCHHGSECAESEELQFACNCSTESTKYYRAIDGLQCEFAATQFCSDGSLSFCVNGGECPKGNVTECSCQAPYEGPRCEVVKEVISSPDASKTTPPEESTPSSNSLSAGDIAIIIIIGIGFILTVLIVAYRMKTRRPPQHKREQKAVNHPGVITDSNPEALESGLANKPGLIASHEEEAKEETPDTNNDVEASKQTSNEVPTSDVEEQKVNEARGVVIGDGQDMPYSVEEEKEEIGPYPDEEEYTVTHIDDQQLSTGATPVIDPALQSGGEQEIVQEEEDTGQSVDHGVSTREPDESKTNYVEDADADRSTSEPDKGPKKEAAENKTGDKSS